MNGYTKGGEPIAKRARVLRNGTRVALSGSMSGQILAIDSNGLVTALSGAPIVAVSGTTLTIGLTHMLSWLQFSSSSAVTVSIDKNATVPIPIGFECILSQYGSGKVTVAIVAASGVTIVSEGGNKAIGAQYVVCGLKKIATDTWQLFGKLIA